MNSHRRCGVALLGICLPWFLAGCGFIGPDRTPEQVRATGADVPTFGFELDMVDRLTLLVQGEGTAEDEAVAADAGYALLGGRGGEIVRWGQALHREVLSILADPDVPDTRAALQDAVRRYQARADVALPSVPKDMQILYDHAHALGFR